MTIIDNKQEVTRILSAMSQQSNDKHNAFVPGGPFTRPVDIASGDAIFADYPVQSVSGLTDTSPCRRLPVCPAGPPSIGGTFTLTRTLLP